MQRFRNILVGVDLSRADRRAASELTAPTQEAVNSAIWLAGQNSAELTLFSALDISAGTQELLNAEGQGRMSEVESDANQVLEELLRRAKQEGVEAKSRLVFGKGWVEIIRQVLREEHDLVVVGTRELGRVRRMLLGSTGMKLLRKCPSPVWVTKPGTKWDEMTILVASDLGEVSQLALEMAVNGGQLLDAKVHLVHALDTSLDRHLAHTGLSEETLRRYRDASRAEAEKTLNEQLSHTDYRTLAYGVQTHVIDGPADTVILQAIEDYQVDLLIMGTVGRGGVPGVLVGNTAERILPEVPCSLLAVKPSDFQSPIPAT